MLQTTTSAARDLAISSLAPLPQELDDIAQGLRRQGDDARRQIADECLVGVRMRVVAVLGALGAERSDRPGPDIAWGDRRARKNLTQIESKLGVAADDLEVAALPELSRAVQALRLAVMATSDGLGQLEGEVAS